MENAHAVPVEKVLEYFNVDPEKGLSDQDVIRQRLKYGRNELPKEEPTPYWKLILEQFEDILVRILLVAAGISFVLALLEHESSIQSFIEPVVILAILICNAIVGVWQEKNAENAINALKQYEAPEAQVIRNGRMMKIEAVDLVPGDIVEIHSGNMVPADMRIISVQSTTLRIDQSVLTGESVSVTKTKDVVAQIDAELQAQTNMAFSGTVVTYGNAIGIVTATGLNTKIGNIHRAITEKDEEDDKTPLKKKLDEFGDLLSKIILGICILVWIVNIGHFSDPVHGGWLRGAVYYFKIAVALAVAAIPEGLPAVVTTCLALGTRRMAKHKAIVRSLPSVETLGCTTVICSDKTGTLTTNKMSVTRIATISDADGNCSLYELDDTSYVPRGPIKKQGVELEVPASVETLGEIAKICALCNASSLSFKDGKIDIIGEPTEAALRVMVEKIGLPNKAENERLKFLDYTQDLMYCSRQWEKQYPKLATLEFSRDRKSMSVYCKGNYLFVKGAPENLLERSIKMKLGNGKVVKLTENARANILNTIRDLSGRQCLRCIGVAYIDNAIFDIEKDLSDPKNFVKIETNLTFVGIVGMMDPPRPEVIGAIQKCHTAGIRVIVITGDNKSTAESICRQIGIFSPNEDISKLSITGQEFDKLSEEEKLEAVSRVKLFSRTEPTHKSTIVQLLKKLGEVVAMTGDGVNDAPALDKADIGIAMGSGTAVAKEACDMVLQDDNFATIVHAVEEGRSIYINTKQFIRYLISSNIGEVVSIFLTAALGMPEALVPVQLLWVNLVTDGLPATALGFNPPEPDIMQKKPRDSNEPIVNGWTFFNYLVVGIYVGVATVGGFAWWYMYYSGGPRITWNDLVNYHSCKQRGIDCSIFQDFRPSTVSLSILVTIEMFNAMNAVSEDQSLLVVPPWVNMWLMAAIALSFILHFAILYIPFLATIFGVAPLTFEEWIGVIAFSFPVILIAEILKFFSRYKFISPSRGKQAPKKDQ